MIKGWRISVLFGSPLILLVFNVICRKRSSGPSRQDDNSGSLRVAFKVFLVILLIAIILSLSIIAFWTLIQIRDLQNQVEACELKILLFINLS